MKILVIDDEPLIHISIEKLIQACSKEDEVLHAYNGHEMLKMLEENDIAMAYVDIKMPGPSGLEAIKMGKAISPDTRYYIMTGFNEFEYAKQAVKLKVEDYLMKPLDKKTIQETITAVRLEQYLDGERRKNVFRTWLESALNGRNIGLGEYKNYFCGLLMIAVDGENLISDPLPALFEGYEDHIVSVFSDNSLKLLCFSEKGEQIQEIYRRLSGRTFAKSMTCFAASVTKDMESLREDLKSMENLSCLRTVKGTGRFYYLTPLLDEPEDVVEFGRRCLKWQDAWNGGDYNEFSLQSAWITDKLFGADTFSRSCKKTAAFFSLVLKTPVPESMDKKEWKNFLDQKAKSLLKGPSEESRVESMIQFIKEHYREDISAADLSERFELSASYLSSLLKNALGVRYSDYVTGLRLNHAKELLATTHMTVKDITVECGWYSQSYFTKLFIEREGCTPVEYRRSFGK